LGPTSAEIERQIAGTRDEIEDTIVELRQRSRETVRRSARVALIAVGVGAGIGTALVVAYVAYRMTRPATISERAGRVVPRRWLDGLRGLRDRWARGFRRRVPPVRLYVGERQVGEEPPSSKVEKLVIRAAQAAGTAAAAAVVSRIFSRGKAA
jgi:hypothetical protein